MGAQLNDDCLTCALLYLPLSERLRLEKVCRRWYNLMPYHDVTKFALDHLEWPNRHIMEFEYLLNNLTYTQDVYGTKWFQRYFTGLLNRFGPFLTSLELYIRHPRESHSFRLFVTSELFSNILQSAPLLRKLYLNCALIDFEALRRLSELKHLSVLSMPSCVLFDANRQPISDQTRLKEAIDTLVDQHPTLTQLNLAQLSLVPNFANSNLRRLHLSCLPLTDLDLERICGSCPNLESIGLTGCRFIRSFALLSQLPLRRLWLNGTEIGMDDFRLICASCTELEHLRIDGCGQLTSFNCLRNLKKLSLLWVGQNAAFTDADLGRVSKSGKLDNLFVSSPRITNEGFRFLARHCSQLQELNICNTSIGDEGLRFLLNDCRSLSLLNAQSTELTNDGLQLIAECGDSLQNVYVQSCRKIDEEGFFGLYQTRLARLRKGEVLRVLSVTAGGTRSNPISDSAVVALAELGVKLVVQRPLLALPGL